MQAPDPATPQRLHPAAIQKQHERRQEVSRCHTRPAATGPFMARCRSVGTWIGANTVVQYSIAEGVSAAEGLHLHGVLSAHQQCAPSAAATVTGNTAGRVDNDATGIVAAP